MARGRRRKAFQVDYAKYQEILATPRATEAIKKDAWSGLCQQWQIANQSAEPGELAWATDCPIQVFPGAVRVIVLGKGKTLDLCWIPPGEFQMGTRGFWGRVNGERIHQVKINRGFWIGKYPVTQEQYEAVMGNNPSKFKSTQNPVEQVNWNDAVAFCQKIKARLPREAEWEYACRAGTTTKFSSSDSDSDLGRVGWYIDNSNSQTHPVGQKQGNFWGLYDMHGNVSEWCSDWYGKNYYKQSPTSGPKGPTDGSDRVLRGGAWNSYPISCRSAFRSNGNPSYHCNNVGFRVCLDE
jgi:formylglycine-generating enzyme required for sulfatase activity